jgi:hypothetical protein
MRRGATGSSRASRATKPSLSAPGWPIIWAADRPKFKLPDGTEVEVRVSLVARREGSEWRIVHWHASIGISNVEAVGQELTTSA